MTIYQDFEGEIRPLSRLSTCFHKNGQFHVYFDLGWLKKHWTLNLLLKAFSYKPSGRKSNKIFDPPYSSWQLIPPANPLWKKTKLLYIYKYLNHSNSWKLNSSMTLETPFLPPANPLWKLNAFFANIWAILHFLESWCQAWLLKPLCWKGRHIFEFCKHLNHPTFSSWDLNWSMTIKDIFDFCELLTHPTFSWELYSCMAFADTFHFCKPLNHPTFSLERKSSMTFEDIFFISANICTTLYFHEIWTQAWLLKTSFVSANFWTTLHFHEIWTQWLLKTSFISANFWTTLHFLERFTQAWLLKISCLPLQTLCGRKCIL